MLFQRIAKTAPAEERRSPKKYLYYYGKKNLLPKYQIWIDARKKYRLSHAHIQMAKELGMNPKKFGNLANHHQELWKEPLPDFIESLYFFHGDDITVDKG